MNASALVSSLRAFADRDAPMFTGFPATREQVRARWADAYRDYVSEMIALAPPAITPNDTSATFAGVSAAFRGPLALASSMEPATAARELADAWRAAVEAIALVPGAEYAGAGTGTAITAIEPFSGPTAAPQVTARHDALFTALLALFANPALVGLARLEQIASALHAATSGLTTQCTFTSGSGPATGPITFG